MKSFKSNLRALGVMCFVLICCWITWQIKPVQVQAVMPTRCEVQLMLRERGYDIVVDGKIGSDSNRVWEIEEKKIMNSDQARYIEKMGGINGDTKGYGNE